MSKSIGELFNFEYPARYPYIANGVELNMNGDYIFGYGKKYVNYFWVSHNGQPKIDLKHLSDYIRDKLMGYWS